MKLKFIVILISLFNIILVSISLAGDQPWERISGSIFFVFYQDNDLQNSSKILTTLQSSYLKLSHELAVNLIDTVSVFITPSKKAFDQIVGQDFPKWSDGLAAPVKNIIILKSARWMPPETDNEAIAIYELTHIIIDRATKGNPIPRWLNEGFAVYYSGEKGYASSTLISKALVTNSIIPLSDIDEVLQFHKDKAQLAYQQSYLAVNYLFQNYGSDAVKQIIQKVGEGYNLNQALIEVIDLDLWEFEEQWCQHIKQKHKWHFLVEFDNYLWVIILALFIFGFVMIRLRNRRTIRRWQEEDDNNAVW